jgi:outer membrane lipoprotein-sorting protein
LTRSSAADTIAALIRPRALILSLTLGTVACGTSPLPVPRPPLPAVRRATLDEVLSAYEAYCSGLQTVSASGDLDVRDLRAGKSQKLGIRLVATRGGRLYLKGSVAVVTALEVVADGERFWFQVPSKKTVWTGAAAQAMDAADAGTEQAPYYALRPADVTAALLPETMSPGTSDSLVLEADRQTYALTLARLEAGRGIARRRVWLQRETLLPLRSRTYDERGEIVSEVTLGSWQEGLPRWIAVQRPIEGYQATFTFSKLERNVAVPERAFVPRMPEGYKVVEVGRS